MFYLNLTKGSSTLIEHMSHHSNIVDSSPVSLAGDVREKKCSIDLPNGSGTLVEHMSHHSNIKGLSPVTAANDGREKKHTLLSCPMV